MRLLNLTLALVVLAITLSPAVSYSLRNLAKSSSSSSASSVVVSSSSSSKWSSSSSSSTKSSSKSASPSPSSSSAPSWTVEQVQMALNKNAQAWAASFLEQANEQVQATGAELGQIAESLSQEQMEAPQGELSTEWATALKNQIHEDQAWGQKDIKNFYKVQQVAGFLATEAEAQANNAEFGLYDQIVNFVDQGLWADQEAAFAQQWSDILAGYNAVFENVKGYNNLKAQVQQILMDAAALQKLQNDAKYNPMANQEVDAAHIIQYEADIKTITAELKANPENAEFQELTTSIANKYGLLPSSQAAQSSSSQRRPKF